VENLKLFIHRRHTSTVCRERTMAENRKITPGYFETMGVSLLRGRDFTDKDGPDHPTSALSTKASRVLSFPAPIRSAKRIKMARADEEHILGSPSSASPVMCGATGWR